MRVLGIDLAWSLGSATTMANESGLVAVEQSGQIVDAGWARGLDDVLTWIGVWATSDTLLMVDAPLLVTNETGQRECETEVGQRYGRWQVSANTTNLNSPRLGGVRLRERLEEQGWRYDDGCDGPPTSGRAVSEVYPYTTLVGAEELGYEVERPRYKRKPKSMRVAEFRPIRAATCDEILIRMATLREASPPLDLASHPLTALLLREPSPLDEGAYKHREDLLDAALCAWTGLLWIRHGTSRCQVLGSNSNESGRPRPTIIAPARREQRAD